MGTIFRFHTDVDTEPRAAIACITISAFSNNRGDERTYIRIS